MFGRNQHTPSSSPPTNRPSDSTREEFDSKSERFDVDVEKTYHEKGEHKPSKGEGGVFDVEEGEEGIRLMGWKMASVLVAKVSFGVGVLSIPATFATLGFVGGIICLLVLWAISTLSSVYIARVRLRHPKIHSVADFGGVLFGPVGSELFGGIYIVLMLLIAGSSILSVTIALNAVSSHALCTMAWAGIACAIVFVVGAFVPDMERVAVVSWLGLACIFVANYILTIAVLVRGPPPEKPADAPLGITVHVSIPLYQAMNAITSQMFACIGSPMFFSISAEMEKPEQFVRASLVGNTFLIANYIIIGCCVYARAGKWISSPTFNTAGHTFRIVCYAISLFGLFVSCLLLTHLGAKYIFVRLLRGTRHVSHRTKTHRVVWALCFVFVLGIGLLLALGIPVFSDLVSLVGALAGGILVITLTALLVLYSLSDDPTAVTHSEDGQDSSIVSPSSNWFTQACRRGMHGRWTHKLDFALAIFLFFLGLYVAAGGTYAAAKSISLSYETGKVGHAFSCADNSV